MNFREVLYEMRKEKKVKNEFSNKHGYLYMFLDKEKGIMIRTLNDERNEVYENLSTEELLSENWEIYEEPKWKPSFGEVYYYINSNGEIDFSYYSDRTINDKRRVYSIGNFFKTDEEADHMVEKLKVIKELKELSNIKFNMSDYLKNNKIYYIAYDFTQNRIVPLFNNIYRNIPFNVYFSTKEDCEEAITKIGKERLERYYFDIKEKEEIK